MSGAGYQAAVLALLSLGLATLLALLTLVGILMGQAADVVRVLRVIATNTSKNPNETRRLLRRLRSD